MKSILIAATAVVNLALVSYSIAVITEQIRHRISARTMVFLTSGLLLDISATCMMIIGSENSPFTVHGILGYSSLTAMLVDAVLLWRLRIRKGSGSEVPASIHIYTRIAYIWWIMAYITGAIIAFTK